MLTKLANMSTRQKVFSIILIVVILLKIFYGVTFKTGQKIIAAQSKIEKVEGKQITQKANEKVNWHDPSENKPYPNISDYPNFWIHVSIEKHRVYLMNNKEVVYTMLCSPGAAGQETPRGTFSIQAERGEHFYNSQSGEGANYWVSFKDHGIYLFHTVPVDANGNYVVSEAEQLGKASNSHGCIRLSIADAKWFYENVPTGAKVVID